MQDIKEIVDAIGRDRLCSQLGVGKTAIAMAVSTGLFPGRWYKTVRDLGNQSEIDVPESLFNWQESKELSPRQAS